MKRPTAEEYHKLKKPQKLYYLTNWFIGICTSKPVYANGRPTADYWRLYKFFGKLEDSEVEYLYEYLASLGDVKRELDVTEFYGAAGKYHSDMNFKSQESTEAKPQKYDTDLLGKLLEL